MHTHKNLKRSFSGNPSIQIRQSDVLWAHSCSSLSSGRWGFRKTLFDSLAAPTVRLNVYSAKRKWLQYFELKKHLFANSVLDSISPEAAAVYVSTCVCERFIIALQQRYTSMVWCRRGETAFWVCLCAKETLTQRQAVQEWLSSCLSKRERKRDKKTTTLHCRGKVPLGLSGPYWHAPLMLGGACAANWTQVLM